MHINRGLLFWGLALVTAGVVALAAAQGWIDIPIMADLWNFWPVVLIVIGLAIVLSRTPFAVIGVIVAALVVGFAGGAVIAARTAASGRAAMCAARRTPPLASSPPPPASVEPGHELR